MVALDALGILDVVDSLGALGRCCGMCTAGETENRELAIPTVDSSSGFLFAKHSRAKCP